MSNSLQSIYALLKSSLENARVSIKTQVESRQRNSTSSEQPLAYIWRGDSHLAHVISNLKSLCMVMSSDFTKLVLMASKSASPEELGSLLGEVTPHIDTFGSYFTETFVGTCSISPQLFVLVSGPVLSLFDHMINCTTNLSHEQWDIARHAVGVIIEISEKKIDKQLPATNKVACRRALMEKVNAASAIIEEFEGYVHKSEVATAREKGECDVTVDNDDDDDEGTYTTEELEAMHGYLDLLRESKTVLKVALDASTEASDLLHPLTQENDTTATVFDSKVNIGVAGDEISSCGAVYACRRWVSCVVRQAGVIDSNLVDFGSELYSPLEDEQVTSHKFTTLKDAVQEMLTLLKYGLPASGPEEVGASFRQMYSEKTNGTIDTASLNMIAIIVSRTHLA